MERVYTYTDENGKRYAVPKSETQEFFKHVPQAQLAGDFRDTKGNAYAVPGNDTEMGDFVARVPDAKSSYRYRSKAGKDYVVPYDEMGDFLKTFRSDDAFKEDRDEIDKRVEELASPKQSVVWAAAKGAAVGAGLGLKDAGRGISRAFTDQIPGLIYKPLAVMMGKDATKVGRVLSDIARDIDDRAEARKWDDPEIEGWAAIGPGAFESVAANVVPAIATHGMSAYAMPALYGLSRAFDVHEAAMESGHTPEQAITLAAGAGAIEGGMEYVSMLWGGGKQAKEIGKAIGGKELARNARKVLRGLVGEVLTEAGTEGIQEGIGNQYDQLAAGDDIDYRQSAVAAGMGAGTGAMAAIIQGGPTAAAKIDAARTPEQRAAYTAGTSPQELAAWTLKNPDMALALAGKESPSRKDFEAAGLPRVPASERARIAADLKELTTAETEQKIKSKGVKAGSEVAPDVMPGPSLVTDDGKAFAPGETVPKGNYTINGQQVVLSEDTPAVEVLTSLENPAEPDNTASVPVMITRKMEADLKARGLSQAEINKMTPQQANDALAEPVAPAEEEAAQAEPAQTEQPAPAPEVAEDAEEEVESADQPQDEPTESLADAILADPAKTDLSQASDDELDAAIADIQERARELDDDDPELDNISAAVDALDEEYSRRQEAVKPPASPAKAPAAESVTETPPPAPKATAPAVKASDFASMSDDDFDKMAEQAAEEIKAEKKVDAPKSPAPKIGRKNVKKAAPPAPAPEGDIKIVEPRTGRTETIKVAPPKIGGKENPGGKRVPRAIIESAAKHGVQGIESAAQGLYELFGANKRLGMGLTFDENTYAKAKPHFQDAIKRFSEAGAEVIEVFKWALNEFGEEILPYLKRFKNELAEGKGNGDNNTDGGQNHDNAGDSTADQGRGEEGAQVGAGDRRPGSGDDAGGVGDHATEDAGGAPKAGSGEAAGQAPGGKGDGGNVSPDGGAPSPDGRAGAVGAELVSDGAGGGDAGGRPGGAASDDRGGGKAAIGIQPNYRIKDPESLVGGGPKTKFARNRQAIETYMDVRDAGRAPTEAERDAIAAYIGWGSFGQELFNGTWEKPAPKKGWEAEDAWLREHLGADEWKSAQSSIINAHYTNPPTVSAMWRMVQRMGFKGGRVLEPSMGIGNFFGLMPAALADKSDLTGIELDELTGGMAKMLYPQANISIKGYQESQTPDGFYDLVIGNWPFAAQSPADRRYNKLSPTLHDYFFLKALDQVRPGGLVVGITSAGTMDKVSQQVRLEMAKKADLVASFRLPMGAFKDYAGTDVVTDIIILRKHDADKAGIFSVPSWVSTGDMHTPAGEDVRVNTHYHENPDHILGRLNYGTGRTSPRPGMIVEATSDFEQRLERAINSVPENIMRPPESKQERYVTNNSDDRVNSIMLSDSGELLVSLGEQAVALEDRVKIALKDATKTEKRRQQIRDLVGIRKIYGELIDQQREGSPVMEDTRKQLRNAYRKFVKQHGRINGSFALEQMKKVGDPNMPAMASLERNAASEGSPPRYEESTILTRSTTRPRPRPDVMTPSDAYVFQRNESLNFDLPRVAELSNTTEEAAAKTLLEAGAIFKLPSGAYEHADVYLSGNVRSKLAEAKAAQAEGIAGMERNIEAITKVMPEDVPYYNIEAKLGNNWVRPDHYQAFIGEMLGVSDAAELAEIDLRFSPQGWKVKLSPTLENRVEARSNFGLAGIKFGKLVEHAMRSTPATVKTEDDNGNLVVDEQESEKANEKVATIQEHFATWVWKDPTRRVELEQSYNEIYNNSVPPQFSGDFLAFEGMMLERGESPFNLRSHQSNAIARGLISGRGIYAHEVGTGKTYTMAGIAIESRRYGKCKKPIIFAHNANSATVAAEINEMYPGAKVLYVNNLDKKTKAITLAQITNDDWDAIVVPHSMIDKFALRKETYNALAAEEIAELEAAAMDAAAEDGANLTPGMMNDPESMKKVRSATAKELVKSRNAIIERINKMSQKSAEDAIRLEDAGIDMVLVDEAHEFKKPPIASSMRMKGLNKSSSDKSINMMFLLQYIAGINNGRGVHLFTGTPITNTLNEMYNMMRFIMPKEMKDAGVAHWDSWFSTFAAETTDVEVTAAGDYQPVSRLASFVNVPELRSMVGQYMDVVFAEDMPEFHDRVTPSGKKMNSPDLTAEDREYLLNGRTESAIGRPYKVIKTVVSEMTPEQRNIRATLMERSRVFRQMSKRQRREVMLSGSNLSPIRVESDATKAGLDARLFDIDIVDNPVTKVNIAVKNVMGHFREHPLACQVIFMESGTSDYVDRVKKTRDDYGAVISEEKVREPVFNVAKDIINKLVEQGVPREQIALVSGDMSKLKRKAVADAMNTGKIRVVIGSTQTLGTGVNMQNNLRAMHHLDAPWRPGDLEQRNGRGHRQGNQWNSVMEYRYVTEGIDGRRWQVLTIKNKFIADFLRGRNTARIIEGDTASIDDDAGGNDLTATLSEATGDPRILMIEKAKKDIDRLQRRERLFVEGQYETQKNIKGAARRQAWLKKMIEFRQAVSDLLAKSEGAPFSVTIDGKTYTKRQDAEKRLDAMRPAFRHGENVIGEYRGFILKSALKRATAWGVSEPKLIASHPNFQDLSLDESIMSNGTLSGLDAALRNNKMYRERAITELADSERSVEHLTKSLDETFPQQAQLDKVISRLQMLEADVRINPVPPPGWLRQAAPIGSTVVYDGKPRQVAGHKYSDIGWFVMLEPEAEGAEVTDAPYMDVTDEQGIAVYEEHEFTPPEIGKAPSASDAPTDPAPQGGDDTQGFAARTGTGEDARPGRGIGARRQDGGQVAAQPTQPTRIIDTIRKLWPGLSVRARATWTQKKAPGWYSKALGEMRLANAGDIIVAVHELGHHFDRELGGWSGQTGLATHIPGELIALGHELYGNTTPKGGFRAEGFAEFVGQYLTGGDIQVKAPKLYHWFTTEYLPSKPAEAAKLRQLEDVIAQFQIQTPEQAIQALLSPRREDWSGQRIAATLAGIEAQTVDAIMPLLRGMMETGSKVNDVGTGKDQIRAKDHPYMLAIYFARTAGGRALHALLENTTDLYGKANGESLKAIMAPAVNAGKVDELIQYWIAKRVVTRYHDHGLVSGLARDDAQAIIDKYASPEFDRIVEGATDWAHRELHLLVEAGAMTEAQFNEIVDMNPIYAPMMRQFLAGEKRDGGKNKGLGKGVFRVRGGQQPIVDPLTALAQQSEKLHQIAMQHAVMRSIVQFYDSRRGKVASMGKFMSEVPAPREAVTFTLEKMKKTIGRKAVELGADPEAVALAMMDTWDEMATIYRPRKDYRGGNNIIGIEIDGKRRFFEIQPDLFPILEGVTQSKFLGDGKIASVFRRATSLQRLGATGLNPAFGLIRNLLRDTGTAAVTADYHFHIPLLSTLAGMVMDIANSDYAKMYHGSGLDIAGRVGQDIRSARKAGRRVTAKNKMQSIARAGFMDGLVELLGHSEIGPRLMEYRGAFKHAKKMGWDDHDALVLAGCASKDVTVNFSRAGTEVRKVNEVIMFANAGVQSLDKIGRSLGLRQALPWAKIKNAEGTVGGEVRARLKVAGRTTARALAFVTAAALANYLRNRDKDWWKKLPAFEKWNYLHVGNLNNDGPGFRIPLPFDIGSIFGALPVALLEERRTPGALKEALEIAVENSMPIDIGLTEDDFRHKVAAVVRNFSLFTGAGDILINEDWKHSAIIPRYLEGLDTDLQYTHDTTTIGKIIGKQLGVAPVQVDHILNVYSGQLYKRAHNAVQTSIGNGAIDLSDKSSIPVIGTLFLRPNTSRAVGDFYERLDELERRKKSDRADDADLNELKAMKKVSGKLTGLWRARREALSAGGVPGRRAANEVVADVQALIEQHNERWAD